MSRVPSTIHCSVQKLYMNEELTITQLTERVDEIDDFLHEDVLRIVDDSSALSVVEFHAESMFSQKKGGEEYFLKTFGAVSALLKANAHLRNYKRLLPLLSEDILHSDAVSGSDVDMLFNKVDVMIEFEGFLSQLKTCLDMLAQSLNPITGKYFKTYGKAEVDGKQLNGVKIVNFLKKSARSRIQQNTIKLQKLIIEHSEEITDIVNLRDVFVHQGRSKKIQGFRFSHSENKVFAPIMSTGEGKAIYVQDYMDDKLDYVSHFAQTFLVITLSSLLPDMIRGKKETGGWQWFTKSR